MDGDTLSIDNDGNHRRDVEGGLRLPVEAEASLCLAATAAA